MWRLGTLKVTLSRELGVVGPDSIMSSNMTFSSPEKTPSTSSKMEICDGGQTSAVVVDRERDEAEGEASSKKTENEQFLRGKALDGAIPLSKMEGIVGNAVKRHSDSAGMSFSVKCRLVVGGHKEMAQTSFSIILHRVFASN